MEKPISRATSPFLFLSEDWFGPPGGFEEHPHRGNQVSSQVRPGEVAWFEPGGEDDLQAGRLVA
jgi:hypothetical protein